jgi:hypothetical protein
LRARIQREDQRSHGRPPELKMLLATIGAGDIVIIPAVDRLSRDTTDLLIIACELQKAGAREAIKRRDIDEETLRSIGRSYNVSPQTIARLLPP